MRITFLLPHIDITGGIRVALEYANHLHGRGHQLIIVYPRVPLYLRDSDGGLFGIRRWPRRLKLEMRYLKSIVQRKGSVSWFPIEAPVRRVVDLSSKHVPASDILMAVNWKTAELMSAFPESHGEKFYLIQGYETWYGPRERVDATWTMPAHKVVVSSWLEDFARTKFGEDVCGPILSGVNSEQFNNPHKVFHNPPRVGMLYHSNPIKGIDDGLRAFRIAHSQHPDTKLIMFGTSKPNFTLPQGTVFYHNPPQNKLKDIYSECDIWLSPSRFEGYGLTAMEAMACQCAVVTTNVGGVPDYTVPGVTALVSPPANPEALAHNLLRLLGDRGLLKQISKAGYRKVQEFSWERATDQLEGLFLRALSER